MEHILWSWKTSQKINCLALATSDADVSTVSCKFPIIQIENYEAERYGIDLVSLHVHIDPNFAHCEGSARDSNTSEPSPSIDAIEEPSGDLVIVHWYGTIDRYLKLEIGDTRTGRCL